MGCPVDRLGLTETVERVRSSVERGEQTKQLSINASKLVSLRRDESLREFASRCSIINADGQSVVWASRILGDPLPERVAGIDLMLALLTVSEGGGFSVYLLGAAEDVLEEAVMRIRQRHPKLHVAGYHNGYFEDWESPAIVREISRARPDLLFVAMSSPRKERWLNEYAGDLDVKFAMGVGGALDVIAGVTRRAPRLLQRSGLEWAFRLAQEPHRMFRRYLVTNGQFLWLLGRTLVSERRLRRRRMSGLTRG